VHIQPKLARLQIRPAGILEVEFKAEVLDEVACGVENGEYGWSGKDQRSEAVDVRLDCFCRNLISTIILEIAKQDKRVMSEVEWRNIPLGVAYSPTTAGGWG
jgi:hypothetical protein